MRAWYCWSGAPPLETLLRQIARREFGPGSEDRVLKAWDHFSRAVRLVPDTGPRWVTNNGVAAPMFLEKPEPRAMTVEHSWFNQGLWTLTSRLNPYWPFTWHVMFLWPDFTNKTNAAEQYARTFTLPVFNKYLLLAADEFEEGLRSYREAALQAPQPLAQRAAREVLLVEQMQRTLRSGQAVLEFEDLRFRLARSKDPSASSRMLDRMAALLKEEIARTELSLETAKRDSRLGYEWEMDYVYTPYVLREKLELLKTTLSEQLPAYRKTR
jgi:hypothetical protein